MIELPEAVVIAQQMRDVLQGKLIASAMRGNAPSRFTFYTGAPEFYADTMPGKSIGPAIADGALIVMDLLEGKTCNWRLVLGGGGERIIHHRSAGSLPKKHQLLVAFTDGSFLSVTVQGWGAAQLFPADGADNRWCGFDKGLMPTDPGFTESYFNGLFNDLASDDARSLKEFIISRPGVRGVGNGYLQDILFRARLHPRVRAATLSSRQRKQLYQAIVKTISNAIAQHGRTDELDLLGRPGRYVRVLGKHTVGQPCPECGSTIEKESFLGGAIYWCPDCQPPPARVPSRASGKRHRGRAGK